MLFVAGMAPLVLLAPIAGALVDRYDSRVLLVWSGLAQTAACLVLVQVHSVPLVLGMVAALGAGQAVNGATWQALLPSIVGADQLPAAIGMSQAVRTAAGIAAPAVGGAPAVTWRRRRGHADGAAATASSGTTGSSPRC